MKLRRRKAAERPSVPAQFVNHGSAQLGAFLLLGLSRSTLTLVRLIGYVTVLERPGTFLEHSHIRRAMNALTGIATIGLAVRLASEAG